jgi:competence protein ComEC
MLALEGKTPARFSLSKGDIGLLAAMILGEQSLLEHVTKREFQRTGAFHILVVSGMNVGILAFVSFAIARWLRAHEYGATAVAIISSLLYAYVTDLGAPILRAAFMLALYLAARLLYRDRYSLNAIGTAAMVLLLAEPSSLFDPSFQLTFLCVLALGGITQPLLERSTQPFQRALYGLDIIGYDAALPPKQAQFRLDLRMIADRLSRLLGISGDACGRWLARAFKGAVAAFNLVVVTAVLQIALALPMIYYFHRVALLGLPTNMVVIPLSSLLLPVAMGATLLTYVGEAAATLPAGLSAALLRLITSVVSAAGGVSFAELRTATPTPAAMIAMSLAFPAAMYMIRKRRAIALVGLTLLAGSAGWLAIPPKAQLRPSVAELTVLDVGQGDSILVVSPDGKTLLVDGGGPLGFVRNDVFEVGEDVVSPYLWSRGISRLDAVALSHAHSDHMGGLGSVIANFRPRELWIGTEADTPAYHELLDVARRHGTRPIARSAGEQIAFGGLQIRVLAPANKSAQTRNDESLILELRYGKNSALLTGDAERLAERAIARSLQHIDVLKIAHHGSATSTTPELVHAAKPRFAAISTGRRNVYGHPKPQVLQRLEAAGVRTFRTDMHGALTFYLDGEKVTAQTFSGSR